MMKKVISSSFFLFASLLSSQEAEKPSESLWDYHPLHVGGNFINVGKADIDKGGNLYYQKANAFLFMLLPISRYSYFFPRVEWNTFRLKWNENPKFNQSRFYYVQFGLTFYSTAIDRWRWILRADYNIDLEHFHQAGQYGLFSGLLWGAYELHRKWHYHLGALGYTGMSGQEVYPIIGLDFAPNSTWLFQAIFPIDYSVQYKFWQYFRLSAKARPLKERFRTGKREPQPKSVFSYSSVGAELNLHFEIERRFEFEIYGGYNFGGDFYIKDKNGHNSLYTHVENAPYFGANLDYAF